MTAPAPVAPVVLAERPADGVGLIRINRPDARNALNLEVRKLLAKYLTEMGDDSSIRCIVLTGNDKAFAAGADIKEMANAGAIEMLLRGTHKLWRTIGACPKPVIAAVSGFALGGGCELAMTCDIIIAGEGARFGQPEVKNRHHPRWRRHAASAARGGQVQSDALFADGRSHQREGGVRHGPGE